jgi:hypothetical protein
MASLAIGESEITDQNAIMILIPVGTRIIQREAP